MYLCDWFGYLDQCDSWFSQCVTRCKGLKEDVLIEMQTFELSPFNRKIPIDMAGFAVNVEVLMKNRYVWMGRMEGGQVVRDGFLESEFLSQFVTRKDLECRSYEKEVM